MCEPPDTTEQQCDLIERILLLCTEYDAIFNDNEHAPPFIVIENEKTQAVLAYAPAKSSAILKEKLDIT